MEHDLDVLGKPPIRRLDGNRDLAQPNGEDHPQYRFADLMAAAKKESAKQKKKKTKTKKAAAKKPKKRVRTSAATAGRAGRKAAAR